MAELFDPFSLDNQVKYILNTTPKFLPSLCGPNSPFREVCKNEDIWKYVFSRLVGETEQTVDGSLIENGSWLEKSRLVYGIVSPRKVYTVYVVNNTNLTSFAGGIEFPDVRPIKTYFNLEGYRSAEVCVLNDFNNRVEPIYSVYRKYIEDAKYLNPGLTMGNDRIETVGAFRMLDQT